MKKLSIENLKPLSKMEMKKIMAGSSGGGSGGGTGGGGGAVCGQPCQNNPSICLNYAGCTVCEQPFEQGAHCFSY